MKFNILTISAIFSLIFVPMYPTLAKASPRQEQQCRNEVSGMKLYDSLSKIGCKFEAIKAGVDSNDQLHCILSATCRIPKKTDTVRTRISFKPGEKFRMTVRPDGNLNRNSSDRY
jgi:hypothetical protein